MRRLVALVLAVLAVPLAARAQEPKSEDDKTLYAIGFSLAERLAPFALSAYYDRIDHPARGREGGLNGIAGSVTLSGRPVPPHASAA